MSRKKEKAKSATSTLLLDSEPEGDGIVEDMDTMVAMILEKQSVYQVNKPISLRYTLTMEVDMTLLLLQYLKLSTKKVNKALKCYTNDGQQFSG